MLARKPPRNVERLIWRSPKDKRKRRRATTWQRFLFLGFGLQLNFSKLLHPPPLTKAEIHLAWFETYAHTGFKTR